MGLARLLHLLFILVVFHGSHGNRLHEGRGLYLAPAASPAPVSSHGVPLNSTVFNVDNYGAKGDGHTDDTKAFNKTWKNACKSSNSAVIVVPEGRKYLLKPLNFSGPCKSHVTAKIKGTLVASPIRSDFDTSVSLRYWILFDRIKNLEVEGGGMLYGNGDIWWKNSCKRNESQPCVHAPTALAFNRCNNLKVRSLRVQDSQQIHVWFNGCKNVHISDVAITAPEKSPNTDGIHISKSKNVIIDKCVIKTGDDCISIVSGSRKVIATNILCGPGHGISIGSLGSDQTRADVSNVLVESATLKGTTNGVRIKTWQGGHGYAKNIIFRDIVMHDVKNPIIINQNYCDSKIPCKQQKSAVRVSHVLYQNIKGTSASEIAINFNCSAHVECRKIVLKNINLTGGGGSGTDVNSSCNNVRWTQIGKVSPALLT